MTGSRYLRVNGKRLTRRTCETVTLGARQEVDSVRIALCCWEDSFVSCFRSYDGTELFYSIYGSGPPLVCLAGGPGADVRSLGDLGGLDRHRTLILLDARGGGRSEVPADPTTCAYTEQTRDVEALYRHLDIERADLLAHSAGTLTAQAFAVR